MSGCICKLVIHLKALLVKPQGVFFSNPFTIDLLINNICTYICGL